MLGIAVRLWHNKYFRIALALTIIMLDVEWDGPCKAHLYR